MRNLTIAILGIWLALVTTTASADAIELDAARTAYMQAQSLFVDSVAAPEITASKGRNFTRYLAKIQSARKVLDQAKASYESGLALQLKADPRFDDSAYIENPALNGALADYEAIRKDVGESALAEAAAAYAEEFR